MRRDELRRLIQGPIATVPTAFDPGFHLDLGAMWDVTQWWVAQGLVTGTTVIKVAAAMGEGPDLGDDEWPHLLRTVVNAAAGRASIVCGLKSKDTRHAIEDAKRAEELGAIGVQIDLPIFHDPNQDDYVRYFTDISDAIEIGILAYNTWWYGVEPLAPETILRLAPAEHVVGIKWSVPPGPQYDYDDMRQFSDIFNVIDNSNQPVRCHRNGGRGYISTSIPAFPQHELKTWQLLEEGRYEDAQSMLDQVEVPLRVFMAKAARKSGGYRVGKGLMALAGHPLGSPRPPTLPLDADEMAELRDLVVGFGWPVVA